MTVVRPYVVTVDFNFEGQKNKYLEDMIRNGVYRDSKELEAARHKPYDFKCSFPGVERGDILVVSCATGLQVVKAVKVSFPPSVPDHATARVIARLDMEGVERYESQEKAYEDLLHDIDTAVQRAAERKHYKKLAKKNPEIAELIAMKELLEGNRG